MCKGNGRWMKKERNTGKSKQVCFVSIVTSTISASCHRHHHLSAYTIIPFYQVFSFFIIKKNLEKCKLIVVNTLNFFVALSVWGMHLNKTITQYFKKFLLGKIKQEKNRKPEWKREYIVLKFFSTIFCFISFIPYFVYETRHS